MEQKSEKFNENSQFKTIKNIKLLGVLKIKLYYKKISTLILFSVFIVTILVIDIVGIFMIKNADAESLLNKINTLVLVLSILLFIITAYITINIFREEISHNIHSLELRYGYKVRELFISRIFSSLVIILSFYLVLLFINLAFGLPQNQLMSIFAYRLYISSLAWYILIILIAYSLSILFSSFFSSIISIISVFLALALVLLGVIKGGSFSSAGYQESIHDPNTIVIKSVESMYKNQKKNEFYKSLNEIDPIISSQYLLLQSVINKNADDEIIQNEIDPLLFMNSLYFGPKGWTNWNDLVNDKNSHIKEIIYLYSYFNDFFTKNKFDYNYEDIIGLIDDVNQNKIEPLANLLKAMEDKVDNKYKDLIKTLFRFNHDIKALKLLNINYKWTIFSDINNIAKEIELRKIYDFIITNEIDPVEVLFYKLLSQSFAISANSYNNSQSKNYLNIIERKIKDETKRYVENQRKNLIFNPLVQFATAFNSVNYYDFYLDNILSSSRDSFNGTTNYIFSFLDETDENNPGTYEFNRVIYPELIYVSYSLISVLIIFGSYFKFKRRLIKK